MDSVNFCIAFYILRTKHVKVVLIILPNIKSVKPLNYHVIIMSSIKEPSHYHLLILPIPQQIVLYNRLDEDWRDRIKDVRLAVKDMDFTNKADSSDGTHFGTLSNILYIENKERIEVIPSTPKTGRYVKVWAHGGGKVLQLCQVEVFRAKGKIADNMIINLIPNTMSCLINSLA